jgi:hypothetical protein
MKLSDNSLENHILIMEFSKTTKISSFSLGLIPAIPVNFSKAARMPQESENKTGIHPLT